MILLQRLFWRLRIVHFTMNGADNVVKSSKWRWAGLERRFITMDWPSSTEAVRRGMASIGLSSDDPNFILDTSLGRNDSPNQLRPRVVEGRGRCRGEGGPFVRAAERVPSAPRTRPGPSFPTSRPPTRGALCGREMPRRSGRRCTRSSLGSASSTGRGGRPPRSPRTRRLRLQRPGKKRRTPSSWTRGRGASPVAAPACARAR